MEGDVFEKEKGRKKAKLALHDRCDFHVFLVPPCFIFVSLCLWCLWDYQCIVACITAVVPT